MQYESNPMFHLLLSMMSNPALVNENTKLSDLDRIVQMAVHTVESAQRAIPSVKEQTMSHVLSEIAEAQAKATPPPPPAIKETSSPIGFETLRKTLFKVDEDSENYADNPEGLKARLDDVKEQIKACKATLTEKEREDLNTLFKVVSKQVKEFVAGHAAVAQ